MTSQTSPFAPSDSPTGETAVASVSVVVPGPFYSPFDYLAGEGQSIDDYPIGSRVAVPFGRRTVVGFVVGHSDAPGIERARLKPIKTCLDTEPTIDPQLLQLAQWLSKYYHHPLGDSLATMLPTRLNDTETLEGTGYQQRHWQITTHGLGLNTDSLKRAPKQQTLLNTLRAHQPSGLTDQALIQAGHTLQSARELAKKQLIETGQQACIPASCQSVVQGQASDSPLKLNDEQQSALELIRSQSGFAPLLLEGLTGSGKTEVYLQAIAGVIAKRQQALVLVPEIGLTPQTVERFARRFDCQISLLHSELNDRERQAAWYEAKQGRSLIVIGTRSAVFTPLARPGLIVVDEEHDSSFKQQDGLRYHARDVAVRRAQFQQLPVVLGSATPAMESLLNAQNSKYLHTMLSQRNGGGKPAAIELIDIRTAPLTAGLAEPSIEAISQTLNRGDQVLVFINRRGFAPLMLCHDCGWSANCDHCDARLTLHLNRRQLHCHHCGWVEPMPAQCPRCQSNRLQYRGNGTEQTTEALRQLYKDTPVLRIDRDTVSGKQDFAKHLDTIRKNQPLIVVGTQMLAKGHDFDQLNTVVVINIDETLYQADFRAHEKALQLLTQVAGRAGRNTDKGQVLVQTHLPDHPVLNHWCDAGYQGVSGKLIDERQQRQLPPFTYMAAVRADSPKPNAAQRFLQSVISNVHSQQALLSAITGPMPAVMEKRAGRHRAICTLKANSRAQLHTDLNTLRQALASCKLPTGLRWALDIDPQDDM